MAEPTRHPLPSVKVSGRPISEAALAALLDVRVEQSMHLPDRFRLRFHDRDRALVDAGAFPMGAPVDVAVDVGRGPAPLLRGEVTQVTVDLMEDGRTELVIAGLDRGHRLARGVKVRTFAKVNDSVVVQQIARSHGLQARVGPTPLTHEYLLQYGTDFAFLGERARALGFEWWVNDSTLFFQPRAAAPVGPVLRHGANLVSLRLRVSAAETCDDVTVQSWDPVTQRPVSARVAAADGVATDAPLAAALVADAKKSAARKAKRFTGTTPVSNAAEAKVLARALAERAASEQVLAKGVAMGDPALIAGGAARVEDAGARLSGAYHLTEVEHLINHVHGYTTRFTAGGHEPSGLVSLLGGHRASRAWIDALLVGVVTNNDDPERLGRVKVRFPSLSDGDESAWARVVSVGAGKSRGLRVVPDVNDEVLVGFEQGDPRRPLVLGGLWSSQNAHPGPAGAPKAGAVWRSHVGHTFEMSDGQDPASRFVALALGDQRTGLRLGEDAVSLNTPKHMAMQAGGGAEWKVRGALVIEADTIAIRARSGVVIEGGATAQVKSDGPTQLSGATVAVQGKNGATVQSGGTTAVRGVNVRIN